MYPHDFRRMTMTLTKEYKDSVDIIRIDGRIDAMTSSEFETQVFALVGPDSVKIVLNFMNCDFINSNGLRILLLLRKRYQSTGAVAVCCLHSNISTVFEIAGFTSIFSIYASEEDALSHMLFQSAH